MNESVLDIPQNNLDSSMWIQKNGKYIPSDEAKEKINSVIKWLMENTAVNSFKLHITGSITSNQYSKDSDIDLHFISDLVSEKNVDEINKKIREMFENDFKQNYDYMIGSHPIEIYFQVNEFQDLMSIGCYDYLNNEWLVGPELLPNNYDPYSEFYNDDMKYINSIISDIRNVILEVYELIIVIKNSIDDDFKKYEFIQLTDKLAKASLIFKNARDFRKIYSSPTSKEDALSKRSSRKWKIADSAFKLLDKFGYLALLKEMTLSYELIQQNEIDEYNVINNIMISFDDNLKLNENINEEDKKVFSSHLNENLSKVMSSIALIASMLAIPNVTDAKGLEKDLKTISYQELNISNPLVTKYMNKNSKIQKTYGSDEYKLSYSNLINLVATIAYNEGMLDHISKNAKGKKYDDRALTCVIWTIINRAGGDANKFANVILRPSQYYSAKHIINGKNLKNYIFYHPGKGYSKITWNKCQEFAKLAIEGKLPMPKDDKGVEFGKRNMIANKEIDNSDSYESWGKYSDFTLGGSTKHHFGYEKSQDGWENKKSISSKDTQSRKMKKHKNKNKNKNKKVIKKLKTHKK